MKNDQRAAAYSQVRLVAELCPTYPGNEWEATPWANLLAGENDIDLGTQQDGSKWGPGL